MKISAKGRYALASAVEMARQAASSDDFISSINLSKSLGISKIYLEQILSSLKKAELISSAKGSGGGYKFAHPVENITAWDVLISVESGLFEKTDSTVMENSPSIEAAIREQVFNKLDSAIKTTLKQITLQELLDYSNSRNENQSFMLNI